MISQAKGRFAHAKCRSALFLVGAFLCAASAHAKIIAATDFDGTPSVPNVPWTPALALGASVPPSALSYALLNDNGTVNVRTNTGVKPVPVGVRSKSMSMNVDFSGVPADASAWTAVMRTPVLAISNTETDLSRLNLSFDLAANRVLPVRVRIESFNASGAGTGSRETTVLPIAVNALYRYSIDLSEMSAGAPAFVPTGAAGSRFRVSFILSGSAAQAQSWPRGAEANYNQVHVDNISYTAPRYFVSQNGGGDGASPESPARLSDIIRIAEPGDVIALNPGTFTGTVEIDRVSGTPSRWITLRPTIASEPPVLRSNSWNTIKIYANASYINIQGLIVRGYLNDPAQIAAGLTLANATADGARIHNVLAHADNPAYAIFPDDPHGRPSNLYYGHGRFNVNGIFMEGRKKKVLSGGNWITQDTTAAEGVHHIRVANNLVYENTGGGIITAKADYIVIENNVVHDNNRYSRYGGSGISTLESNDFDGGNGYKIYINGNISHSNGGWVRWGPRIATNAAGKKVITINFSDGNGIIVDCHNVFGYSGRTLVQNNLVYENGGSGIHSLKSDRVDIVNNTAFRNSRPNEAPASVISYRWVQQGDIANVPPGNASAVYVNQPPAWFSDGGESMFYGNIFAQGVGSDVRIRNNIAWARAGHPTNEGMPANSTGISYDNNLFGRDGSSSASGGTTTTGFSSFAFNIINSSGNASDVFANISAQGAANYLRLRPASAAIDAGNLWFPGAPRKDLSGRARPVGLAPDLGAFEFDAAMFSDGFEPR
ncbi:MAG: right-handed parallel beta-helix repeat-containing protein [Aquimonas sp.]|nr:right-handed parallel beta-helix repeat-containing protein [Aquimonas sp.]